MKKYRLSINWVWCEEFDYEIPDDTPLPDNWKDMSPTDQMVWFEQFECKFNERWPVAPLEVVGIEEV